MFSKVILSFTIVLLCASCSLMTSKEKLVTKNNYHKCSLSIKTSNDDVTEEEIESIRTNMGCNILEDNNDQIKILIQKPSETFLALKSKEVLQYKDLKSIQCPLYNDFFSQELKCFSYEDTFVRNPSSPSALSNNHKILLIWVKEIKEDEIKTMMKGDIDGKIITWHELIAPDVKTFHNFSRLFLADNTSKRLKNS